MAEKLRKCGECRERAVAPTTVDYETSIDHDGRTYAFSVPGLPVFKCDKCDAVTLGEEALEKVEAAFRKAAGLLSPAEIKWHRTKLGLTQEQLAQAMSISDATLCRWETGVQIQQRSLDKFLRLVFESSDVQRRFGLGGKVWSPRSDLTSYEITLRSASESGSSYELVRSGDTTSHEPVRV
jgi:putative zinc finger/helix-turn-helix YgiT family protein